MSARSGTSRMTPRFGIDTSVVVRLVTGEPQVEFERCVEKLRSLIEDDGAEIVVSNQVIGEAYVAVQHHYGVSKTDARAGLLDVLRSGMVAPLNGRAVLAALEAREGAGLLDRLIAEEYSHGGLEVLTLDRRMASLPAVRRL
ncbi:MAG: type II toxin-antitoxin system VapC family toxin [Acidobacteria bacterium]|nr:type II toxin-antitoxin system VapC family toxin [Acidobacteriota bacterium]MYK90023.1 type II toxin-antitoxin system VapC family toxin [Acidobacteriota bacterium]